MVWWSLIIAIQFLGMGEFGGGVSEYDLLITDSNNSNGSFCTDRVALNCSGQEAFVILDWFINETVVTRYLFEQSHTFPRNVIESPVNITIVNASISNTAIDIISTLEGRFDYLNGVTIQCGRDTARSEIIVVEGDVPEVPDVTVTMMYVNLNAEIEAKVVGGRSSCSGMEYSYLFLLMNATGSIVDTKNKTCRGGVMCNVVFQIAQDYGLYTVEVIALNNKQNLRSTSFMSNLINVTETREQLNVTSSPCLTSITCHTLSNGTCDVTLSGDNIDMTTVSGPVNGIINLPSTFLGSSSIQYDAIFNSSFVDQGNFTGDYPPHLSSENATLVAIGVLLCILSIVLLGLQTLVILPKVKSVVNKKIMFIIATVIWLFIVIIDAILWIITAVIVGQRKDTCDEEWQKNRDNLVIAAFVFALFSLFPSLQLLLIFYTNGNGISNGIPINAAKKEQLGLPMDLSNIEVDDKGMTLLEKNLSGGHREMGESSEHANLRIREEITDMVKSETKKITSNTYDHIDQVGSKHNIESTQHTKTTLPDPQMYSNLDRRKLGKNSVAPDNNEYSGLQHNIGAQGLATKFHGRKLPDGRQIVAGREVDYGQLDPSQMDNNQVPNSSLSGGAHDGDNLKKF